jgi:aspartate oxidase
LFCVVLCRSLFVFSVVCVAQCLVFCVVFYRSATQTTLKTNNDLQNRTQNTKHWATQTTLKTNNDLQNTTQNTKHWATQTTLKTNNDLHNTTQNNKHWATQTPLKTNNDIHNVFSVVCVAQCLVFCSVDHCLFLVWFVLLNV